MTIAAYFFHNTILENGWSNPAETSCVGKLTAGVVRKEVTRTVSMFFSLFDYGSQQVFSNFLSLDLKYGVGSGGGWGGVGWGWVGWGIGWGWGGVGGDGVGWGGDGVGDWVGWGGVGGDGVGGWGWGGVGGDGVGWGGDGVGDWVGMGWGTLMYLIYECIAFSGKRYLTVRPVLKVVSARAASLERKVAGSIRYD